MALKYGDRVQETFTTTGTGTISLGGAATGYQAFSAVCSNSDTCYYTATDGTNWEVGLGTYATSGNTLARTQILASSNSGSAVSWSAGTKNIWLDFPAVVAANTFPQSYITGLLSSSQTFTSSTVASMTITAGQAADSTNTVLLNTGGSTFSWNITNGNAANGYQGGTTLPNSSTIHFFAIAKATDTKWTACFASTSTTPTLPSGYTGGFYRLLFSINTNSSGKLFAGTMRELWGGAAQYTYGTVIQDVSSTTLASGSITNYTLTVPSGYAVQVMYRAQIGCPGTNVGLILYGIDTPTTAPTDNAGTTLWSSQPGHDTNYNLSTWPARDGTLICNTSAQVGAQPRSGTVNFAFMTLGYIMFRRN